MNIFDSAYISAFNKTSMFLADVTSGANNSNTNKTTNSVPAVLNDVVNYLNGTTKNNGELNEVKEKVFGVGAQIVMIIFGVVFMSIFANTLRNIGKYAGGNATKIQDGKEGMGRGGIAIGILCGIFGIILFAGGIVTAIFG